MRHREAWAVEKRAPNEAEWAAEQAAADHAATRMPSVERRVSDSPVRRKVGSIGSTPDDRDHLHDVLIVVTKLKKYIRAQSGMNTSDSVLPVLSEHVRRLCDRAMQVAEEDGRKTVLDRDFQRIL